MKTDTVYRFFPGRYAAMKSFEDHHSNTIRSILSIRDLRDCTVVELGAGTGNITFKLAEHAKRVVAFDRARPMLRYARRVQRRRRVSNCEFRYGEHQSIPLPAGSADVVVLGWTLTGIVKELQNGDWHSAVDLILTECNRLLKDGGSIMILETANMAGELPFGEIYHPSRRLLAAYLESHYGYGRMFYRNAWDFRSLRNIKRFRFWFGDKLLGKILQSGSTKMEECVGIWSNSIPASNSSSS